MGSRTIVGWMNRAAGDGRVLTGTIDLSGPSVPILDGDARFGDVYEVQIHADGSIVAISNVDIPEGRTLTPNVVSRYMTDPGTGLPVFENIVVTGFSLMDGSNGAWGDLEFA